MALIIVFITINVKLGLYWNVLQICASGRRIGKNV